MATDDPTIAPTASDEVRSMRTFALTVAYDGSHYAGWQSQPNGPTIQQTLAQAISRVVHHNVNPQGAGRTDAGVHAIGQVATFSSPNWKPPAQTLALAINGFLPRSISVIESKSVVPNFDPIRSASSKRYRYTIRSSRVPDPLLHPFHWWIPKELNTCNMQAAANRLLGTHDFKAFETLGSPRKTSVRTIHALDVNLQPTLGKLRHCSKPTPSKNRRVWLGGRSHLLVAVFQRTWISENLMRPDRFRRCGSVRVLRRGFGRSEALLRVLRR